MPASPRSASPRVALVTCATLPALDPDDRRLIEPLASMGVEVVPAVWDDQAVNWATFDLAVIRNTWDYPAHRTEFVHWARRVPRLVNPADVIEWNTDKRYLAELAAAGVPTVPTSWLTPGDAVVLPPRGRHVLKPSVGAGSVDAAAFRLHDTHEEALAREHANRLLMSGTSVMVQPYIEGIEEHGETALMFMGGEFSHAVVKGAMLVGDHPSEVGGLYLQESIAASEPTDAEMEISLRALGAVPGGSDRLAYARVDLVPDTDGNPLLIELELTEPSLFLAYAAGAAQRFARVLAELAAANTLS
jgi:glutathione synthase/RimK-type ligase-like ATP-grasp enzyme